LKKHCSSLLISKGSHEKIVKVPGRFGEETLGTCQREEKKGGRIGDEKGVGGQPFRKFRHMLKRRVTQL